MELSRNTPQTTLRVHMCRGCARAARGMCSRCARRVRAPPDRAAGERRTRPASKAAASRRARIQRCVVRVAATREQFTVPEVHRSQPPRHVIDSVSQIPHYDPIVRRIEVSEQRVRSSLRASRPVMCDRSPLPGTPKRPNARRGHVPHPSRTDEKTGLQRGSFARSPRASFNEIRRHLPAMFRRYPDAARPSPWASSGASTVAR